MGATGERPLAGTGGATGGEGGKESAVVRQEGRGRLTGFKQRGAGAVELSEAGPEGDKEAGGRSTTTAIFSVPGDYVLRVPAND